MALTPVFTGITNPVVSWTNFATSGGTFLVVCNGTDAVAEYNGSVWSNPSITGVTGSTLNFVFPFKDRLFFLQKNSSTAYFLGTDSISGAVGTLNVGPELRLGGVLIAGGALTLDGGFGPDDFCVFVSDQGEVVIYAGSDPSNAAEWNVQGSYRVGRPIGSRCLLQVGGDLALLTEYGVVSLTSAVALDPSAQLQASFTNKIRRAFSDQYALTGTVFGWQMATYPSGHFFFVNVPIEAGTVSYQYVMNNLTGAWCRFTDMNAQCWVLSGDNLYFGDNSGNVFQYNTSGSDNGNNIEATYVGNWTNLGMPVVKHVKWMKAFAQSQGNFSLSVGIGTDLSVPDTTSSLASFTANQQGALWDSALWDVAEWGGGTVGLSTPAQAWLGVAGSGTYIAPIVTGVSNTNTSAVVEFIAANLIYETGSPLG